MQAGLRFPFLRYWHAVDWRRVDKAKRMAIERQKIPSSPTRIKHAAAPPIGCRASLIVRGAARFAWKTTEEERTS